MIDNPHWHDENCRRNSFNVFRKELGETRDTYRFKTRDLCVEIQNRDFSVTVEDCQPLSGIDWTKLADNNLASWRSWVNGLHSIPKPDQPEFHRNFSKSLERMQTCLVLHLFLMNSDWVKSVHLSYVGGQLRVTSWRTPARTVFCRFHTK
jgi:hypothetical protein